MGREVDTNNTCYGSYFGKPQESMMTIDVLDYQSFSIPHLGQNLIYELRTQGIV